MTPEQFSQGLGIALAGLAVLLPALALFAKGESRKGMTELLHAIPSLWAIVEQERRHDVRDKVQTLATQAPLERAEQLAIERFGKLSTTAKAVLRQELRAYHEWRLPPL